MRPQNRTVAAVSEFWKISMNFRFGGTVFELQNPFLCSEFRAEAYCALGSRSTQVNVGGDRSAFAYHRVRAVSKCFLVVQSGHSQEVNPGQKTNSPPDGGLFRSKWSD
jgi:hypothetical protein